MAHKAKGWGSNVSAAWNPRDSEAPDLALLLPQVPTSVAEATHAYLVGAADGSGDEWAAVIAFHNKVVFAGLGAAFLDAWVRAADTAQPPTPEPTNPKPPAAGRRRSARISAQTTRDKALLSAVTAARKYVAACDGDTELAAWAIHAGLSMNEVWDAKDKGALDLDSLKTLARLRI